MAHKYPSNPILSRQKIWYIPDREQFLKYADDRYTEENPQRLALANFLRNTQRKSICPLENIAEELQDLFRMDLSMQDILEDAQRLGVRFGNQIDLRMFIKLCIDLSYHSRRYVHCGHTLAELGLVKESPDEVMAEIHYDENYRDPLLEMGSLLRSHFAEKKTVTGKPAKTPLVPAELEENLKTAAERENDRRKQVPHDQLHGRGGLLS